MSKRIFKAMMAVTLTTLLVCMALFIAILFPYFETQLSDELRNELEYLAPNVERDGLGYLERLGDGQNRLTLIDADGTVLLTATPTPRRWKTTPTGRRSSRPLPRAPAKAAVIPKR